MSQGRTSQGRMSQETYPFDPPLEKLPATLPIFPLPGVLLLPGGTLPLNVFEPRYLAMIEEAMRHSRMIGMVQPVLDAAEESDLEGELEALDDLDELDDETLPGEMAPEDTATADTALADSAPDEAVRGEALGDMPGEMSQDAPLPGEHGAVQDESEGGETAPDLDVGNAPIYRVGCAGRIVQFAETDDGRYLITLRGLVRFRIVEELPLIDGYRQVRPDYTRYAQDLERANPYFDRQRLMEALQYYFDQQEIEADWEAIRDASNERLVTSLAMVCPFSTAEKQALLEAPNPSDRAETMTTILEMAVLGSREGARSRH